MKVNQNTFGFIALGILLFTALRPWGKGPDTPNNPLPTRTIEVIGSADMEIVPDQTHYLISYSEFGAINSSSESKGMNINKVEKKILEALNSSGIKTADIQVNNLQSWSYWWYSHCHSYHNHIRKTLEFKVKDPKQMDQVVRALKAQGLGSKSILGISLGSSSHADIQEYRAQLKMEAIQAAKTKASLLLGAIDEKVGDILEVVEIEESQPENRYYGYNNQSLTLSNTSVSQPFQGNNQNDGPGMKPIKLRYQFKTVFQIK